MSSWDGVWGFGRAVGRRRSVFASAIGDAGRRAERVGARCGECGAARLGTGVNRTSAGAVKGY
ncbi:hypothetical protein GCM10010495_70480 [Kitasatospora herbaricolor]|nr:hypothetical protein GCM10010495_70480 [Kitasatospora herbaricolor]